MTSNNMVTLMTESGKLFNIDRQIACMSETIKHLLEICDKTNEKINIILPIPYLESDNTDTQQLNLQYKDFLIEKIIEYCTYHHPLKNKEIDPESQEATDIIEWDNHFICPTNPELDQKYVFSIILSANFLGIQALRDLCCKAVADVMRNKSSEEIRHIFNIPDDIPEERKQQIKTDNSWLYN